MVAGGLPEMSYTPHLGAAQQVSKVLLDFAEDAHA
jgi:hypothetical protein